MDTVQQLTVEQEAEAARIEDILMAKARVEVRQIARLLASKANGELFGQAEFAVRDHVHKIGAAAYEAALDGRKKGGTSGRR